MIELYHCRLAGEQRVHAFSVDVLAVEQLAKLIHKSPASIRSDASRNPSALPPICRLPGNKRLLWRLEDVEIWLAKYVDRSAIALSPYSVEMIEPTGTRKRGRPRKTEARSGA